MTSTPAVDSRPADLAPSRAELTVAARDGASRIDHLYQSQPLRLLFPRPERDEPLTAVLANTSGGIVGGDNLDVRVTCAADAQLLASAQAAEKVYRSAGPTADVNLSLSADAGAGLEWLPQGTILFDRVRLRRRTALSVASGGRMLAGEVLMFGRTAMGERLMQGFVHDAWRVRYDGRLVWADSLHLDGDLSVPFSSPVGFADARAAGMVLYVADDAPRWLEMARDLLGREREDGLRGGATAFERVLLLRWLGAEPRAVRAAFGRFWSTFRAETLGRPARLPTLWRI